MHDYGQSLPTRRRFLHIACVAALAAAFMVLRLPLVYAADLKPPSVPKNLEVPPGHKAFLKGHAVGTQNYICLPAASGLLSWTFFGPQATLFNDKDTQIITHFLSPNLNPQERGTLRPTWQHSRDTSMIWAKPIASSPAPGSVAEGAIPWLLLEVVGTDPDPTGGKRLTRTTFIQRLNTSGGIAPSSECTATDQRAFVPYKADYILYKAVKRK